MALVSGHVFKGCVLPLHSRYLCHLLGPEWRKRMYAPLLLLRIDDHSMWNTLRRLGSTVSELSSAFHGPGPCGCSPLPPSQGQEEASQYGTWFSSASAKLWSQEEQHPEAREKGERQLHGGGITALLVFVRNAQWPCSSLYNPLPSTQKPKFYLAQEMDKAGLDISLHSQGDKAASGLTGQSLWFSQ